jgi:hypothetical protein
MIYDGIRYGVLGLISNSKTPEESWAAELVLSDL